MNRRDVLKRTAAAASILGIAPQALAAIPPLPEASLRQRDPDAYWKRVRAEQFYLAEWRHFLNNGSLGVTPRPVMQAVVDYMTSGASLTSDEYHRWGYETLDPHREELAAFLGCKKDELALMHNATEAMSTIAGGLDLKAGDEVLITDQEHPSGRGPWFQKAARYGITVREVVLPLPARSAGQLADVVVSAIGPKTKVLSFSAILTTMGMIMPVKEICEAARVKGVLTVVDGAHVQGQIPFRIGACGCDFYAGSPHKWLFAPAGCGILYIREEHLDRLWANTVTGNWDQKSLKAARFMMVGTNNRAIFEGMMAGKRFHEALTPEAIFERTHALARRVYNEARQRPYVEMLSSEDHTLYGALVGFRLRPKNLDPFWAALRKRRIWTLHAERIRISTHVHSRQEDVDALFEVMDSTLGKEPRSSWT